MPRVLVIVLLLGVACGPPPEVDPDPLPFPAAGPDDAPDPSKLGPFPVGVRTLEIIDSSRKNPDGGSRHLVTEVWYPATQATLGKPGARYEIQSFFTAEQVAMIGDAGIPTLQTIAVRDAPPAATHGPFPLVVFSHGQGAFRWQSTYLTVFLASHGYVVASPDHEGGTLYDAARGNLSSPPEGIATRPPDVSYVASRLGRLPKTDPLAPLVDLQRLGVCGHSFGALTSLRVAALDKRVKAIVPQAPVTTDLAWLGLPKPVELNIPVQVQAAHEDKTLAWNDNVAPTWAALKSPRQLLDIVHGGHFTFSDICQFDLAALSAALQLTVMGGDLSNVLSDGCGPTSPSAAVAQPLMRHFAIGFFNAELRGSTRSRALLSQTAANGFGAGVATFASE